VSDPIVTLAHARTLGYCASGMRAFSVAQALDWQQFRTEGLPASVFEGTGDAMAIRVAALAREQAGS
jgi:hypothetical protein